MNLLDKHFKTEKRYTKKDFTSMAVHPVTHKLISEEAADLGISRHEFVTRLCNLYLDLQQEQAKRKGSK